MNPVEHEPDVCVDIPVHAHRGIAQFSTEHVQIVQSDLPVTCSNFPGAPATRCPLDWVVRNDGAVGADHRIIFAQLARKGEARLRMAAVEMQIGNSAGSTRTSIRSFKVVRLFVLNAAPEDVPV